jgi:hypothetical protein
MQLGTVAAGNHVEQLAAEDRQDAHRCRYPPPARANRQDE